jgi:hypothetical protein
MPGVPVSACVKPIQLVPIGAAGQELQSGTPGEDGVIVSGSDGRSARDYGDQASPGGIPPSFGASSPPPPPPAAPGPAPAAPGPSPTLPGPASASPEPGTPIPAVPRSPRLIPSPNPTTARPWAGIRAAADCGPVREPGCAAPARGPRPVPARPAGPAPPAGRGHGVAAAR